MPNYFQGTIQTLGQMIQDQRRQRMRERSPEYQFAMQKLMTAKKDMLFRDTLRQKLRNNEFDMSNPGIADFVTAGISGGVQGIAEYQQDRSEALRKHDRATALAKYRSDLRIGEIEESGKQARLTRGVETSHTTHYKGGGAGGGPKPVPTTPLLRGRQPGMIQFEDLIGQAMRGDESAYKAFRRRVDSRSAGGGLIPMVGSGLPDAWLENLEKRSKLGEKNAENILRFIVAEGLLGE